MSSAAAADIRAAKLNLEQVRAKHGQGSGYGADAFNQLCQAYGRHGRQIDALSQFSPDEEERFFAHTRPGPDGHAYWAGPESKGFRRNDGRYRLPHRWWWEMRSGPIGSPTLRLRPLCGDPVCINPDHMELYHYAAGAQYTDMQCVGALQVAALRLGRSPTTRDFRAQGLQPSHETILNRFGGWEQALRAAGLPAPEKARPNRASPEACRKSLQAARAFLGAWPTVNDYRQRPRLRAHLTGLGLPTSVSTIRAHLGGWPLALEQAGKR